MGPGMQEMQMYRLESRQNPIRKKACFDDAIARCQHEYRRRYYLVGERERRLSERRPAGLHPVMMFHPVHGCQLSHSPEPGAGGWTRPAIER